MLSLYALVLVSNAVGGGVALPKLILLLLLVGAVTVAAHDVVALAVDASGAAT